MASHGCLDMENSTAKLNETHSSNECIAGDMLAQLSKMDGRRKTQMLACHGLLAYRCRWMGEIGHDQHRWPCSGPCLSFGGRGLLCSNAVDALEGLLVSDASCQCVTLRKRNGCAIPALGVSLENEYLSCWMRFSAASSRSLPMG